MATEAIRTCAFYVMHKKRNCKVSVTSDSQYCIHHTSATDSNDLTVKSHKTEADSPEPAVVSRRRIPCPLDDKHSCYEDHLERHLKKCNARDKPQPIFYERKTNPDGENRCEKMILKDVADDKLVSILDRLEKIFAEKLSEPLNESSVPLETELQNGSSGGGGRAIKHLKQNASIVSILEKHGLIEGDTCFVEFGAGRGQLTHWLILACKRLAISNSFVLIDRSSQRHKFDNRHNQTEDGPHIFRLKIDIEHLNLSFVDAAKESKQLVAVGKHLCGAATDLAMRCLTNFQRTSQMEQRSEVRGVLVALCCHHRCSWASYVGKEFLGEFGFGEEEFNVLTSVASWATCGDGTGNGVICENQRYLELGLPRSRREELGFKSKRLLNHGRIAYLRDNLFLQSRLVYFVDRDVSLENEALLAC